MAHELKNKLQSAALDVVDKITGKERKKNIIFYFTDQQRYDTANNEIMPNLYSLMNEGVTYTDCYTCQPVCGPARACMQSGVYATETGCYKNNISLPRDITPLAEIFADGGYDTAYIGKWHLASDKDFNCAKDAIPRDRLGGYRYFRGADVLEFTSHGYDGYVFDESGNRIDFNGYRADCINDFALEYLDNAPKDKPFFMFISQLEPHHQNDRGRFEGYRETVEKYRDYPIPEELKHFKGNYSSEYADYLSAINRIDYNLGRLVDKLKEKGIYEETVIFFTSDHGCHFKTRNMEYKRSCHDSSTHVPLVIRGGGFRDGKSDNRLVSLIDLPSTLLSVAGIGIPDYFRGYDLSEDDERDCVYIQISESQCGRAIRTKEYKYSVSAPTFALGMAVPKSPVYIEEYLYSLNDDPMELHNLIKDPSYSVVRKKLKKMLIEEMEKAGEGKAKILPAVIVRSK